MNYTNIKTYQSIIKHIFPYIKEVEREKISTDFLPFCIHNSQTIKKFIKNSF